MYIYIYIYYVCMDESFLILTLKNYIYFSRKLKMPVSNHIVDNGINCDILLSFYARTFIFANRGVQGRGYKLKYTPSLPLDTYFAQPPFQKCRLDLYNSFYVNTLYRKHVRK